MAEAWVFGFVWVLFFFFVFLIFICNSYIESSWIPCVTTNNKASSGLTRPWCVAWHSYSLPVSELAQMSLREK